jgi:hypothetical protein
MSIENEDFEEVNDFNESNDSNDSIEDDTIVTDDDMEVDIVIEVSDDDLEEEKPEGDDVVLSKHKLQGKHSLKYDSIFKGKKEDISEEDDINQFYFNDSFEVDKSSILYDESQENEKYLRNKKVKERIYEILSTKTKLNFLNNRRKPSKIDFNNYYHLLKIELEEDRFSNVEIFNELSVYFSDNLFNMFKLLDNKWRNLIIKELHEHIGKEKTSKEITNRNIYEGTELEFIHTDITGEEKLFTGVVLEVDYSNSTFRVDSFENIYDVHISFITKILNNEKFKNNLSKLDNIDFL